MARKVRTEGRGGVVEEISIREGDELARVEVRHGPKPKKDKDGMVTGPWPQTTSLRVSKGQASKLKVGSKVIVNLRPAGGQVRV